MRKYILEIAVFVCGAIVMMFEIVGSRILAPYLGTSLFVWTSLIGIILGSLSLGYYVGGKVADKNPSVKIFSLLIFLSGICIGLTLFFKDPFLLALQTLHWSMKTNSVLASFILFSPASVFLGMISPYAVKLKIHDLSRSGSTVGNLYALSTMGSIAGTFLAGFYLIPVFGTNKLLLILSGALIALSWIMVPKKFFKIKFYFFVFMVLSFSAMDFAFSLGEKEGFIDIDTEYNRVWISDEINDQGTPVRVMRINSQKASGMFLESDQLLYEYTKYYHLAAHFFPDFRTALMIGAGGYSYPKDYLQQYSEATLDVVEIDPELTELAKKYFYLQDDPRIHIFHEDARTYMNVNEKKYDIIFVDAFSSQHSIPYQLTTREALQKEYDSLTNQGLVIVNIISSLEGESGEFLRAEYRTFQSIFPQVYLFPVQNPENGTKVQNIMLVALKSETPPEFKGADPTLDSFLKHLWKKTLNLDKPMLTDDFAPVDAYINRML